jgi:polysaccharide deacetylase 2 family uncharacterized protein YibQ
MAARRKATGARRGAAGRKRRGARGVAPMLARWRKALPLGLLLLGMVFGIGIGFGLSMLPPAPSWLPVAMDVPPATPAAKKPEFKEMAAKPAAPVFAAAKPPAPPTEPTSTYAALVTPVPVAKPVAPPPMVEPVTAAQPISQVAALPQAGVLVPAIEGELPLWRKNAASYEDPGQRPMIAIVLDDVGVAPQHARAALDLPAPIVLSIMTYADKAVSFAEEARQRGHEVMVHMPMQPMSASIDPGPHALMVGLSAVEIAQRVDWGLSRFSGYVGFNNHMGSRFTQDAAGMQVVLEEAKARGLLFLDSKTIAGSVGDRLAAEMGVTHIARDVFLDDTLTESAITRQLATAEAVARKRGYAVAIGHPHPATIAVLKRWLVEARARGIAIVPLTAIVKKRDGVAG